MPPIEAPPEHPVDAKVFAPKSDPRILGYDLARALAFLGMAVINYWVLIEDPNSCPKWLDAILSHIQGRSAATFVVLAGVGISLLSRRASLNRDVAGIKATRFVLWRRALFLLIIGLLNSMIWPADILHFYGIFLAIGAFLLMAPNRRLLGMAAMVAAVFSFFMILTHFDPGEEWGAIPYKDYLDLPRWLRHLFINGHYPFFPWAAFLFMGMWIGRQNLSDHTFRMKLLGAGTGTVVLAEFSAWTIFSLHSSGSKGFDFEKVLPLFSIDPWEPMILFMLSAGGTALLVITLSLIVAEKYRNAKWLKHFVAVGQLSLTLYVTHIMIGYIFLEIMKSHKIMLSIFPIWGAFIFFAAALLFSFYWRERFQKGPLEWLMRLFPFFSITSRAKQGMQPRAV